MTSITVHTMEYRGECVDSDEVLMQYSDGDFDEYKRIYEDCFFEMRAALGIHPAKACDTRESLRRKAESIFLYKQGTDLVGSVAVYGNEIDDLIVAKDHQRKGYGKKLLTFAIAHMQGCNMAPIILRVVDWNKVAIRLYVKMGFCIIETETIKTLDKAREVVL